jgi:hypothetical protein
VQLDWRQVEFEQTHVLNDQGVGAGSVDDRRLRSAIAVFLMALVNRYPERALFGPWVACRYTSTGEQNNG